MQYFFSIRDGKIVDSVEKEANIWVFTSPTDSEKEEIIQELEIDGNDLDAALDPDEISRVEFAPKHASIIWKQPYKGYFSLKAQFEVMSVGFFILSDKLIMIMGEETIPFSEKIFDRVNTLSDVVLRYFFYTSRQFLSHLKAIKQVTSRLESKLNVSMENKYFLQMFEISESLVYYIDAIEANGAVLAKLRSNHEKITLTQRQLFYLDDIIHENSQSARQAGIYSSVLSGLMDARGNIINNNVNVLLRNLTLINVIFLPLNLIAGMGGMSEFSMMLSAIGITWPIGYLLFSVAMILLGWSLWVGLKKYITNSGTTSGNGDK